MTTDTNNKGPASKEKLAELHALFTQTCFAILNEPKRPRASTLGVIRSFLRDNGIEARSIGSMKAGLQDLAGIDLPFPNH